jgi:hypothetical protein
MQDLTPLIEAINANTEQLKELTAKTYAIYETLLETEHANTVHAKYQEWKALIEKTIREEDGKLTLQDVFHPANEINETLRRLISEYRQRHPDGSGLGNP